MLDYIIDALRARTEISAWQVMRTESCGHQLFIIRDYVESMRRVDAVKYNVTVHQLRDEGGRQVLGESSFVYLDGEDIGPKLDLALTMAKGVSNQPWTLPGPDQRYMGSEIKDASIALSPDKVVAKVKEEGKVIGKAVITTGLKLRELVIIPQLAVSPAV